MAVMWEGWLTGAATGLGIATTEAGILLSLVFLVSLILFILIITRGKRPDISLPITGLLGILIFLYMRWLPVFTGSILAVIFAAVLAKALVNPLTGGG